MSEVVQRSPISISQQNHCSTPYRWHAWWWICPNRSEGHRGTPASWL